MKKLAQMAPGFEGVGSKGGRSAQETGTPDDSKAFCDQYWTERLCKCDRHSLDAVRVCMAKRSRERRFRREAVAQATAAAEGSSGPRGRGNTRERRKADRSMNSGAGWPVNEKTKPTDAFPHCGNTTGDANANKNGDA